MGVGRRSRAAGKIARRKSGPVDLLPIRSNHLLKYSGGLLMRVGGEFSARRVA